MVDSCLLYTSMPVERVREILKISQEPVSLETPIGEEEDSHLGDFIQDDNVPVPAEAAAQTPVSYTHLDVYKRQKQEWQRAYKEINDMEHDLASAGAIVLKFWMQIDKDEQERRFRARQENPDKQWKITDEDWRNREKWDQYEEAVNEMLIRTSTPDAPWIVVEGNCKYLSLIHI